MIADQWADLLQSWSRHILATGDYHDYLPEEVIDRQNQWSEIDFDAGIEPKPI